MKPLKPFQTYEEQIALLRNRGMLINNENYAIRYLQNYNYSHLNPYFKIFLNSNDQFMPDTSFENVIEILHLDIRFKELIWLFLQRIELKFKTSVAYSLGREYTSYGFYSSDLYQNTDSYFDELRVFEKIKKQNNKRELITHHKKHYGDLYPIWVIVDIFSFSQISLFYSKLKVKNQRLIAHENYPGLGNEH